MSRTLSLQEAFEVVPDPREASGGPYVLETMLTLVVTAMLGEAQSLYAIA